MVELETVLAPITFGSPVSTRFIGMTQLMGDSVALGGKPIAFERFVGSKFICEDGSSPIVPPLPPVSASPPRSKGAHLRLVVDRDKPATLHFEMDEMIAEMMRALEIVPLPRLTVVK